MPGSSRAHHPGFTDDVAVLPGGLPEASRAVLRPGAMSPESGGVALRGRILVRMPHVAVRHPAPILEITRPALHRGHLVPAGDRIPPAPGNPSST